MCRPSILLALCLCSALPAQGLSRIFAGGAPRNVAELRAMERHTQKLLRRVLPCTVSLGGASGVIVGGGYVLSAGHVTQKPGIDVMVTLADGSWIRARTLGTHRKKDTGLLRIISKGEYPCLEMGSSKDLKPGQWCLMIGFPGGRKRGRSAPLRLGRILRIEADGSIVTDCTMSSGDSGGPLVDMQGRVIGINSRITANLATNLHVPIEAFRQDWKSLVQGEVLGREPAPGHGRAVLGVWRDPDAEGFRVLAVVPGLAAAKVGIRVGDRITKFDGKELLNPALLPALVRRKRPGDRVRLELERESRTLELRVTLSEDRR
ncbi:MAG: S1C family serine protease [Planctomycetota bacterium]